MAEDWSGNYFNYFTEIEEHFQRARGSGLFLLSPLDWALIETWKNSGVPLEAALRGIDEAFKKWRSRKKRTQAVNSVAYCTQAVMREAESMKGSAERANTQREAVAPFPVEAVRDYLNANADFLDAKQTDAYREIAGALRLLAENCEVHCADFEDLERRLTALEDKMFATARAGQSDQQLLDARRQLDGQLRAYRSKMTVEQLSLLERQFLDRCLLEQAGLRRLSLFYLGG